MSEPFRVRYDRRSDVLYVTTSRHGPAYGEEDAPGLIWRYSDDDDSLIGVTVMDYSAYWRPRFAELIDQMASHFHVSPPVAKRALEAVNG